MTFSAYLNSRNMSDFAKNEVKDWFSPKHHEYVGDVGLRFHGAHCTYWFPVDRFTLNVLTGIVDEMRDELVRSSAFTLPTLSNKCVVFNLHKLKRISIRRKESPTAFADEVDSEVLRTKPYPLEIANELIYEFLLDEPARRMPRNKLSKQFMADNELTREDIQWGLHATRIVYDDEELLHLYPSGLQLVEMAYALEHETTDVFRFADAYGNSVLINMRHVRLLEAPLPMLLKHL